MSVVSDMKAAYQAYRDAQITTNAARQDIIDLGPRPTFGDIIATDPEYDDIVTAQGVWDAAIIPLREALAADTEAENTAKIDLYGVTDVFQNQWVKFTGLTGSPTTAYVGLPYFDIAGINELTTGNIPDPIAITAEPANNFPDQTPL